ncbi:MAG: SH3 domain-containing protein [Alphaproteobacteria bacterium]
MVQRASGFARRPSGGTRAAERARSNSEPQGEPIPLDLLAVVAPYKRHRGISIRLERLAHGARLSQGRNNGDRSWSLAPDELDGLEYVPPTDDYDAHTLAVRIISLDGGDGETLAVIDLPIAGKNGNPYIGAAAPDGALSAELQQLRDELVKTKSSLAARETELATARRQAEDAEHSRQALKAEFGTAEEAWDRELREQLSAAAAEANANLERTRAAWETENASRETRSAATAQRTVGDARKRWQQEAQAALVKAQAEWKVAEVARIAAAEATWRTQSEKQLQELRKRAEDAEMELTQSRTHKTSQDHNAEVRRLREQLISVQASLATRGAELAEARAATERAQQQQSQEGVSLIAKAEQAWKAAEAKRLASAEARWNEQSARALTELNGRLAQTEAAFAEARAQAEARQHQVTATQLSLAERERELAQARANAEQGRSQSAVEAEQTRERWQQEMAAALAKAQESFKAAETARFAAAEAQWKAQLAPALAETTAQLQRTEAELAQANAEIQVQKTQNEENIRRLRDELVGAQAALASHESELAELRTAAEQARATADHSLQSVAAEIEKARKVWKKESDAAFAKAEKKWRSEEAPRFAAAEAKWQEQVAHQLDQAQERLQRAENGLSDARACSEALRHELAAAQASLAHREIELAEARAAVEQERERMNQIPLSTQDRKPTWEVDAEAHRAQFRRRLIRDFSIVACLFALVFMLFPRVEPVVADVWPQDLSLKADLQPLLQMAGLSRAPVPVAPVIAGTEPPHAIIDVRVANLRESPSTGAAVVTKLARNMEVVPVERRGSWVFVRIGQGNDQKQGWIASAVLKDMDAAAVPRQ